MYIVTVPMAHPLPLWPHVASPAALAAAGDCRWRYLWESRWGEMLIEVVDAVAYVNGQRVEPAELDVPASH